jgi:hypothetical protein
LIGEEKNFRYGEEQCGAGTDKGCAVSFFNVFLSKLSINPMVSNRTYHQYCRYGNNLDGLKERKKAKKGGRKKYIYTIDSHFPVIIYR